MVNVELPNDADSFEAIVYNAFGQRVLVMNTLGPIDLTQQNEGIYFVNIKMRHKTVLAKIIKTK